MHCRSLLGKLLFHDLSGCRELPNTLQISVISVVSGEELPSI